MMSKKKRNIDHSFNDLLEDLGIKEHKISEKSLPDDSLVNDLKVNQNRSQVGQDVSIEEKPLQPLQMLRHYYIQSKLGSGGMGEVFRALDTKTQQTVAIKSMKFNSSETSRNRFVREYKFLHSVSHENLIKAYDFFEEGTKVYMVLEFVQGESLKEILEQKINIPLVDKVAIANKIARGIEILNTAGIIHRDIKPANIMISRHSGIVKILDLGLGKAVKQHTQLTMKNQVIGTAMYLSPEQTEGRVTKTSDIFALGIVMYQLFTGKEESPFHADNPFSCYVQVCSYHPPQISDIIKNSEHDQVYKELSRIVAKAMAKSPLQRWEHVKAVADRLEQIHQQLKRPATRMQFKVTLNNPQLLRSLHEASINLQDLDVFESYIPDTKVPPKRNSKPQLLTKEPLEKRNRTTRSSNKFKSPVKNRLSKIKRRQNRSSQQEQKLNLKNIVLIFTLVLIVLTTIFFIGGSKQNAYFIELKKELQSHPSLDDLSNISKQLNEFDRIEKTYLDLSKESSDTHKIKKLIRSQRKLFLLKVEDEAKLRYQKIWKSLAEKEKSNNDLVNYKQRYDELSKFPKELAFTKIGALVNKKLFVAKAAITKKLDFFKQKIDRFLTAKDYSNAKKVLQEISSWCFDKDFQALKRKITEKEQAYQAQLQAARNSATTRQNNQRTINKAPVPKNIIKVNYENMKYRTVANQYFSMPVPDTWHVKEKDFGFVAGVYKEERYSGYGAIKALVLSGFKFLEPQTVMVLFQQQGGIERNMEKVGEDQITLNGKKVTRVLFESSDQTQKSLWIIFKHKGKMYLLTLNGESDFFAGPNSAAKQILDQFKFINRPAKSISLTMANQYKEFDEPFFKLKTPKSWKSGTIFDVFFASSSAMYKNEKVGLFVFAHRSREIQSMDLSLILLLFRQEIVKDPSMKTGKEKEITIQGVPAKMVEFSGGKEIKDRMWIIAAKHNFTGYVLVLNGPEAIWDKNPEFAANIIQSFRPK